MSLTKSLKGKFKATAAALALAAPVALSAGAMTGTAQAQENMIDPPAASEVFTGTLNNVSGLKTQATNFQLAGSPQVHSAAISAPAVLSAGPLTVGPVAFAAPWVLLGLMTLPLLWWLMRSVPPKPVIERFPAMRILYNMKSEDQEPSRMPLWQRLLRLTAVSMLILGLAKPELNPDQPFEGEGPVMLVVDNGWASAKNWDSRVQAMQEIIERAEREGRQIMMLTTAPPEDGGAIRLHGPLDAKDARQLMEKMKAHPWPVDRQAALEALKGTNPQDQSSVVWLSNGLNSEGAAAFADRLDDFGTLKVLSDADKLEPYLLVPPTQGDESLTVTVRRASSTGEQTLTLTATDESGRPVSKVDAVFKDGETEAKAVFDLPIEMRNQLTRVTLEGENTAGAVILLDERWRQRPVGLIDTSVSDSTQPLLNESNYIGRALDPYVDLRQGNVDKLLERDLAVMVMTDDAVLDKETQAKIAEWVKNGGTLLRFAGPRLAATPHSDDELLPVDLREGERVLGGQLSGTEKGKLAPFDENSPFHGLKLPGNISIEREVLAQPGFDLEQKTWARLDDGTPLVTAEKRGNGWVVLVHTTADTNWSNLPLSGLFVDMMRAIVMNSQGVSGNPDFAKGLPPLKVLNERGQLADPKDAASTLTRDAVLGNEINARTPPGFYGDTNVRHAHNLAIAVPGMDPLTNLPIGTASDIYEAGKSRHDLTGPLLAGALALVLVDLMVLLGQQGQLPGQGRRRRPAAKPDNKAASLKPAV